MQMPVTQRNGKTWGVVQINTNRSTTSMDLALALAGERDLHFILCSEPNKRAVRGSRWFVDTNEDAAITRVGMQPEIVKWGAGKGFVWIKTVDIYVYSCYISPNTNEARYECFINDLFEEVIEKMPARLLISGDFNAKSPLWGSLVEDRRGEILGEMMSTLGLVALNEPGVPTFVRGNSRSTIDMTAISEDLIGTVAGWKVLERESLSPHRYITFEVKGNRGEARKEKWRWGPVNSDRLSAALKRLGEEQRCNGPEEWVKIMQQAYKETTRRVRTDKGKMPYWWTPEIGETRATVLRLRRRVTRERGDRREEAAADYRDAKKNLCRAIKASKRTAWRKLLEELDEDVFGEGYRITMGKLKAAGPKVALTRSEERKQINNLFPRAPATVWTREETPEVPLFTLEELEKAAAGLKGGRAPGPDRIPPEVVKIAAKELAPVALRIYNDQLGRGVFPAIWKKAKITLLEKPKKEGERVVKYRPVCLIDAAGKLYEIMLNNRLRDILENGENGLSTQQHGFRKGHSTVSAIESVLRKSKTAHRERGEWCVLTLIDVKNAFNTANWRETVDALENKGIPSYLLNVVKDYLTNRNIESANGLRRAYCVGVPQGSVLGPTLWNAMYDGIFGVRVPEGVSLVGYADDVAVVAQAKAWDAAIEKTETALRKIGRWLTQKGLEMAPEKTEVVVLKYGRRNKEGTIRVANRVVTISQNVKYLGVVLDTSVSFGPHVKEVAAKAQRTVAALVKIMPNMGGPGESRRRTLAAVGVSVLLYAAPVWAGAMRVASYRRIFQSVHRKLALRVARGYRTVSYDAAVVVASMIPIHLLAEERSRLW